MAPSNCSSLLVEKTRAADVWTFRDISSSVKKRGQRLTDHLLSTTPGALEVLIDEGYPVARVNDQRVNRGAPEATERTMTS